MLFSIHLSTHLQLLLVIGGLLVPISSGHWVRGRVNPGQVITSLFHHITKINRLRCDDSEGGCRELRVML